MKKEEKYIRFFECCVPVKGLKRTAIYDLQRSEIHFVPKSIIELIESSFEKTLGMIRLENIHQKELFEKQLQYLIDNEIVFLTHTPELFTPIDKAHRKSFKISFIYLKVNTLSGNKLDFLSNIDKHRFNNLVIIFENDFNLNDFNKIISSIEKSMIKSITLLINNQKLNSEFEDSIIFYPRVKNVVMYNTTRNQSQQEIKSQIKYTSKKLSELLNGGITSMNNFILNLDAYLESLYYNLFYYGKLFIEDNGDFYLYYGAQDILGNIYENEILETIENHPLIENFWSIHKDKIEECKNCEFKYICPDNRIPVKHNNNGIYVHQTSCKYNPESMYWETGI